jgi:glycosyltransferase involved in cell wall biosynthesis
MIREVSVISTIYNDEYLLNDFIAQFEKAFLELGLTDWEFIIVDDGSSEVSLLHSKDIIKSNHRARLFELNRNFGQHVALAAALDNASKEIVIRCNLDMQDSIDKLREFFDLIEAGNPLVIGRYTSREVPQVLGLSSKLFYGFLGWLTGVRYYQNTASLRVFGSHYAQNLRRISERNRLPQALDAWLGFEPKFVEIAHSTRKIGKSSYNFKKRAQLALDALFHFSSRPLYLLFYFGVITCALSVILILLLQVLAYTTTFVPGYLTLACTGVLLIGMQAFMLGLIGLYIAHIFEEVKDRPLYIMKNRTSDTTKGKEGHYGT